MSSSHTAFDALKQNADAIFHVVEQFPKTISDDEWVALLNIKYEFENNREALLSAARSLGLNEEQITDNLRITKLFEFLFNQPARLRRQFCEVSKIKLEPDEQVVFFQYLLSTIKDAQLEVFKKWADRFVGNEANPGLLDKTSYLHDMPSEDAGLFVPFVNHVQKTKKIQIDRDSKHKESDDKIITAFENLKTTKLAPALSGKIDFVIIPSKEQLKNMKKLWEQIVKIKNAIQTPKEVRESKASPHQATMTHVQKRLNELEKKFKLKQRNRNAPLENALANLNPMLANKCIHLWYMQNTCMIYKNYIGKKIEDYLKKINQNLNFDIIHITFFDKNGKEKYLEKITRNPDTNAIHVNVTFTNEIDRFDVTCCGPLSEKLRLLQGNGDFSILLEKFINAEIPLDKLNKALKMLSTNQQESDNHFNLACQGFQNQKGSFSVKRPVGYAFYRRFCTPNSNHFVKAMEVEEKSLGLG